LKERVVPSAWLEKEGRRLDCGPYLSGAIEARLLLDHVNATKDPLRQLTLGGMDGIFHAGRHSRTFVSEPQHGVPFLSSSDVLLVDFSHVDLISRRQIEEIPQFLLGRSWTLITRSGTIGRMAYSRPDIDGLACSEHVLRVVPNPDAVKSGYLYSFLSSRFGVPMVIGGTYGSIIQSIEPQHIAELPVPIAPDAIQNAAHKLVEDAAELRTKASAELRAVIREIEHAAGLPVVESRYNGASPDISVVSAMALGGRMDGLFHSAFHRSVLDPLLRLSENRRAVVADFAERVFEPARFKRINVDDATYGVPFFGTSDIMRAEPVAGQYIVKRTPGLEELIVTPRTILVPRSGQLVGIIGHAVLPHGDIVGGAVSEDAIRVVGSDDATAGYLFACLSSEYGRRQLKARAFGSSIPHLDVRLIRAAIVPRLEDGPLKALGLRAFRVAAARSDAVRMEREARRLVEDWIEQEGKI